MCAGARRVYERAGAARACGGGRPDGTDGHKGERAPATRDPAGLITAARVRRHSPTARPSRRTPADPRLHPASQLVQCVPRVVTSPVQCTRVNLRVFFLSVAIASAVLDERTPVGGHGAVSSKQAARASEKQVSCMHS